MLKRELVSCKDTEELEVMVMATKRLSWRITEDPNTAVLEELGGRRALEIV